MTSVHVNKPEQHPTITLSPPPDPAEHRSFRRKRSFRTFFNTDPKKKNDGSSSSSPPVFVSALGRRLSNLSLRSPSPSPTETIGAAAVAASFAAAAAALVGHQDDVDVPPSSPEKLLHPNAAYQQQPPSPCSSSSLSSPGGEECSSPTTTVFGEMKRVLSQYQQIRSLSSQQQQRRRSSSSSTSDEHQQQQQPALLHEKYGEYRKVKTIGSGATATIRLLESTVDSSREMIAVKTFKKRDRDETEKEYQKRMTSEFCISKTLRHRNIIETYDLVKDHKGRWCAVMEYVKLSFHDNNNSTAYLIFLYTVFGRRRIYDSAGFQSQRCRDRLPVQATPAGPPAHAPVRRGPPRHQAREPRHDRGRRPEDHRLWRRGRGPDMLRRQGPGVAWPVRLRTVLAA